MEHLDAAALRARVREAGAGTLELQGASWKDDAVSFGGAELAGALAAEGAGLTGLDLRYLELGADGWRAVFEALRKGACPRLATLVLNSCDLGPAGGAALAAALLGGGCPALTDLVVGNNGLGDAGFGALAEALGDFPQAVRDATITCHASRIGPGMGPISSRNSELRARVRRFFDGEIADGDALGEPVGVVEGDALEFRCTYANHGTHTLRYGLSALNEMCGPILIYTPHDSASPPAIPAATSVSSASWQTSDSGSMSLSRSDGVRA